MVSRRRARWARGYSLLEILVVLTIIGLLTAAVGFALFGHFTKARIETTRQNALKLRSAAQLYRMNHNGDECPTIGTLVNDEVIDKASRQTDAWDRAFTIACDEKGDIRVSSAGPDGKLGTPDDIIAPAPPQVTAEN